MDQRPPIAPAACARNHRLEPLGFLIGDWLTIGRHPLVPRVALAGRTAFDWHHGGAFIMMRSEVDDPRFPDGVAIIGSDDGAGSFALSYFDERGVSRLFALTIGAGEVTWRRDDPVLAQCVTVRALAGGDELISTGRMSKNGGDWTDDLSQHFRRA